MTDAQAIQLMRQHAERHHPKECPNCHQRFASLREYLLHTQPLGAVISYDAEAGDWHPAAPLGTASLRNCACGTTLTLTSEGMPILQLWRLLHWARIETRRRNIPPQQLLELARAEIHRQVLAEPAPGSRNDAA